MMRLTRLSRLAIVPLAFATLTACEDERSVSTEPVGPVAYGVRLLASPSFNIPRGSVTLPSSPTGDNLTIAFRGLDSLESGSYAVWAGSLDGSSFKRLTGNIARVRTDTVRNQFGDDVPEEVTLAPLTGVSAFQDGNPATRFTFTTNRAQSGLSASDEISTIIFTVESDPAATAPTLSNAFLWARRGTGTNATLRFGNYAVDASEDFVFPATARGGADWRDNIVVINDSSKARPPRGFFWNAWMVRRDTLGRVIDYLDLGPATSPYPNRVSLRDADVSIPDPQYVFDEPYAIGAAAWRFNWQDAAAEIRSRDLGATRVSTENRSEPFAGFSEIYVTLEHKSGAAAIPSPHIIIRALVPTVVAGL